MRIIAIANQKGGCGKTTTAVNLSASLAQANRRVLLVDLDPQGHSTLGLNIKPIDLEKSMYDVLTIRDELRIPLSNILINISPNLDLAPSNIILSAIEQELSGKAEREEKLYKAISELWMTTSYDFVIIDCPPSLGLLTFNGLTAANEVIATVDAGFYSIHGIGKLFEIAQLIEEKLGHKIQIKALVTMFDTRTRFAHEVKDEINKYFNGNVYDTLINTNVRLKEASSYGQPIITYDKRSMGATDYSNLAKEVLRSPMKDTVTTYEQKSDQTPLGKKITSDVEFTFIDPDAKSVYIAGDFNGWKISDESRLQKVKEGEWRKVFNLESGRYQYKYVVDGEWITDPQNPKTELDRSGNKNSLLEIN